MKALTGIGSVAAVVIILGLATAGNALAHCDTLDGPVVNLARQALAKGDVKIILPWVAADKALETGDPVAHGGEEGTHDARLKPGAVAEHKH